MKPRHNVLLVGLLMVAILATMTGCTISDKQLMAALVEGWMQSKGISPVDEEGDIDLFGAVGAIVTVGRNAVGASTGDDELDAILGLKKVLDNMAEAERLVDEGTKENNPGKIDEAIRLRPKDWSYRTRRASLALIGGDLKTAVTQLDAAEAIPKPTNRARRLYLDTAISDLEFARKLANPAGMPPDQCWLIYTTLALKYKARSELTGSQKDMGMASEYQETSNECQ